MRNTKWNIKTMPNDKEIKINDLSIDSDILKILYSRGIKSKKEIINFLNPKLENIRNPYGLYDMEKSVNIISEAIKKKKNIWIYGDYDVDGITSTSILYLALKELGAHEINYYIPIRDEGYGLNIEALKKIKDSGADLVITVDCGITAFEEIRYANSINLSVIITDHHNLNGKTIPDALAVINPKRSENTFLFDSLAGVGTIFMVIMCLFEKLDKKENAYKYLDLVAIGTIADIVPLLEENRIMTRFGLDQLPYTENKGLRYLLFKLFNENGNSYNGTKGLKAEYTTYDVGFIIAPVFNAAGRLKDAKMVVKLLISDNNREIEIIVKELINKNFERKELQNNIIDMIEKNIEEKDINKDFIIVDYSSEYHHGVIGIAASKIVDTYYKPVVIMEVKEDEGIALASCRSIENFNILEALQSMPELFVKFGGHAGAAGFTIPIKNIGLFRKKINEFAKEKLSEKDFIKVINIDKQIPIQKISYEFFKMTELLKPFGFGNPNITFQTRNVMLENIKFIGESKNHIMFDFKQKGFTNRNAVWFGAGEHFKELNENLFYDIVYKLKVETYLDRFYTKVYIDDMKKSELKDDTLSYYHSLFSTSFPQKSIFYTGLELKEDIPLTGRIEFEQISLFQGRKFVGRLDYNVSNLLVQLKRYYNWNFSFKVEKITKTASHNIVDVLIKRDYNFESFDYTEVAIFNRIKEFLIGNMEYSSFTKKLLASFFRNNNNLIILNDKIENTDKADNEKDLNIRVHELQDNLTNFILTLGIYYWKIQEKKSSLLVTENKNNIYNNPFIKNYFNIVSKYEEIGNEENSSLVLFITDRLDENLKNIIENMSKEGDKRFCIILNTSKNSGKNMNERKFFPAVKNIDILENRIIIPENIIFLNSLTKEKRKNVKNIYLEYLPLKEKLKLKSFAENNERIYSDNSICEIL